MMEPEYRFCTSADGTRIAYATYGSGPPLFFANTWAFSMDAQFTWPEAREFIDALASRATLVIFDRRGTGASAREVEDLSPEAEARDIAAVADAVALGKFPLFADATASAACACYASAHSERVERLVLWCPHTSNTLGDFDKEWARSIREDWSYDRRRWAGRIYTEGPVSLQKAFSSAIKASVTAEMAARRVESHPRLASHLGAVTTPTLVLQREESLGPLREHTIQFAGLLPNAQLRFVAGRHTTAFPEYKPVVEAVFEFIGLGAETLVPPNEMPPSGTAVILFADIVDSTALTECLGDAAFRAKARDLDAVMRMIIRDHSGTPIEGKLLGDGVLATFASAAKAIEAALACGGAGEEAGLPLHLGLHAGDVIREEGNVFGGAVNIASRISGLSAAGELLVSDTVRSLGRTSAGVSFEDRGEQSLKGVGESVRVWAVREAEA
jgi:class 3 adenylate cyclase